MILGRARRVALAGSVLAVCAIAAGTVYVARYGLSPAGETHVPSSASILQPLLDRCDEAPSVEVVAGGTRTRCTARRHPAFMIFVDAKGDAIDRAGLMVPMHPADGATAERIPVGLEMFSLLAGAPASSFVPPEQLADIGLRKTRFVRDGLVYVTQPMANVGLVFAVTREK